MGGPVPTSMSRVLVDIDNLYLKRKFNSKKGMTPLSPVCALWRLKIPLSEPLISRAISTKIENISITIG
eukprot:5492920-Prymnesium_polylepis.1